MYLQVIHTSSVDVQLYIRKYSPFGKDRQRLLYIRESDLAANCRHSGVTYFLATFSHEIWIFLEFKACNFRKGPGIYSILTYGVYTYGVYTYGVYIYGMYTYGMVCIGNSMYAIFKQSFKQIF